MSSAPGPSSRSIRPPAHSRSQSRSPISSRPASRRLPRVPAVRSLRAGSVWANRRPITTSQRQPSSLARKALYRLQRHHVPESVAAASFPLRGHEPGWPGRRVGRPHDFRRHREPHHLRVCRLLLAIRRVRGAGRMLGQGHIDQNKLRHHFVFRVAQSDNKDSRFVLGEPIARMPLRRRRQRARGPWSRLDDASHDHDQCAAVNRFVASDITSVVFSDDPAFEPNRHDQPTIDTVRFAESENGTAGPATPLRSWLRTEANPAATGHAVAGYPQFERLVRRQPQRQSRWRQHPIQQTEALVDADRPRA